MSVYVGLVVCRTTMPSYLLTKKKTAAQVSLVCRRQSTVNCGLKHYLPGSKFCIQPPGLTGKRWNLHIDDRAPINNESCY